MVPVSDECVKNIHPSRATSPLVSTTRNPRSPRTTESRFNGARQGLKELDQHTRRSEIGHSSCLFVTAALTLGVLATGSWEGAVWLVALGILLHLYPALLQRLLRARIQAIPISPSGGV